MAAKTTRKAPTAAGVKTASQETTGLLEAALLRAAAAADWLELSDAAALELARSLARMIDKEPDSHAAATLTRLLNELGLTVRGRRDRTPAGEESPLEQLIARAARPALAEGRDPAA